MYVKQNKKARQNLGLSSRFHAMNTRPVFWCDVWFVEFLKGKTADAASSVDGVDVDSDDEQNVQEEFEIGDFAEGNFAEKLLEGLTNRQTSN